MTRKVFGLCPSCQELAWHNRDRAGLNLYICVKCGMSHEIDLIPRVNKQTESAA
jgi:Zn ribbon nucleic-acid-binding protein